ncbi:tRNA glutamyl-Q(34) synthetase GluQRS [Blastochloris sulfoviridis]|uniref:tRNA glutamyl-Q(34) synthetase GluQRS n=1 Tax=Blastochloris sulfoviridis TaxID=50712 RepID=A0A5M6HQY6_9HYPH|nr:tRNA glutamyl-Q(34) synthetase GluQRS [Blastochloris sulfoviridis]KAA5598293.1 tRNA glutamyl-Q(34) synthetase GluQRS [Blastochloris sulfoviridis]
MRPVFRFAPSPNGYLHLGHALSALLNAAAARAAGGRLLLRIEDIDTSRCRPAFEAAILEDLAWLGLAWEEPVRRQSAHFDDYRAALGRLEAMGLAYPAVESRGEIRSFVAAREADGTAWPRDPDGVPLYPGAGACVDANEGARRMAVGAPYVIRLDMRAALERVGRPLDWPEEGQGRVAADPAAWGDVVLARKDIPTSYHLSVVVDDALQGVTHVVRGQDLYAATAVHRLLQELLGIPVPSYRHHRLVLDDAGRKLSKSTGAVSLRALRQRGATPADIRRMVGLA